MSSTKVVLGMTEKKQDGQSGLWLVETFLQFSS